ncbi:MAG TPA: Xaa-Pro peptidase family protein [Candidatus Polarisedimenticolia bacterium]|nr:Xaa-Pro peptidase family protein [Candidatus Polarisedimenticolia bacterium]
MAIVGVPDRDADLLYAAGYACPDPLAWFQARGKTFLMVNDLELAGARSSATVDAVLPLSRYFEKQKNRAARFDLFVALAMALREKGIRRVEVPHAFPAGGVDQLRSGGVRAVPVDDPFFPARARKTAQELRAIGAALRATETGLATAVLTLKASRVGRDGFLYLGNERLTSELVREKAERAMFAAGAAPERSIVAGGAQGADPHCPGSGPLVARRPIVLDFFPRHRATGYYGDLTRTVVKGRADGPTLRAFEAVSEAQRLAFKLVRHGADAAGVHASLSKFFEAAGYPARMGEKRREGFFHGTGHGIGLELHEAPVVGRRPGRLEAGQVITIEPGLYYRDLGGIRIEDVVLVTRDGCRRLSRFPVFLEIP